MAAFHGLMFIMCLSCIVIELPYYVQAGNRKEYVVYMGNRLEPDLPHKPLHLALMKDVVGSEASKNLLYSYGKSFNGFVANLTDEDVLKLERTQGVISVFPNEKLELATTRSWDFMGFPIGVSRNLSVESDIIVGLIDTGIWPESPSFDDKGMGPPPARWKGICQNSTTNFTCNRKIIGGRYFQTTGFFSEEDVASPRDTEGHGTHVASTIVGSAVGSASFLGLAAGTARGGVPSARIAVYKACWFDGCFSSDILAAFDAAIADGVDIISISIGFTFAREYLRDPIAIGSFHALRKGILTSASAGNSGPFSASVGNVAPWQLSVAASTIDRKFTSTMTLGNGATFKGLSLNTIDHHNMTFPVIYGGTAQNFSSSSSSGRYCTDDSLNGTMVQGKIVLCDMWSSGGGPFNAGAVGAIMNENNTLDVAFSSPISTSFVGIEDGIAIFSYITSTVNPVGSMSLGSTENNTMAPLVASFSSRGPNPNSPSILKPDLTAPGVLILAAWSHVASPSGVEGDKRRVEFNIISGTSMACPHATASAAYVKSFHPTWSPSAIKSALMTTAFPLNASLTPEAEFAYGSGHINPVKAVDPGLVYDAEFTDYMNFLCAEGLNSTLVGMISGDNATGCPQVPTFDLNYPSMTLNVSGFSSSSSFNGTFSRTVKNVGPASEVVYKASVTTPKGLKVTVVPSTLSFKAVGETASFRVVVNGVMGLDEEMLSASLVWDDGVHQVKSPIVVYSSFLSFF